jgi:hypothetical protein
MRIRQTALVFMVIALLAAACSNHTGLCASNTDDPTLEDLGVVTVPPAAAVAGCDAATAAASGVANTPCPALDGDADASEFSITQISSTERESVASALNGENDGSYPAPTIDLSRILSSGQPPDGIPAVDEPVFQNVAAVDWLTPAEAVLAFELDGEARAHPIQVLTWHELVNDTVGDAPVTVSYGPLCNSALAYDRRVGDRILDFGTSGRFFNSSMVMYDRQTESLWTHFDATAVAGLLAGTELTTYPISTVSWQDFRDAHPDGLVLTRNTGHSRPYGQNPYRGYDDESSLPFLFDGEYDPRLASKTRVVVVRNGGDPAVAFPLANLGSGAEVFEAHGESLVAVVDPGTASPLDQLYLSDGYDQGAVAVFENTFDGESLDLSRTDDGFLDAVTGTTFDVFGGALDGSGRKLTPVEHLDTFWFAIATFDEEVEIMGT